MTAPCTQSCQRRSWTQNGPIQIHLIFRRRLDDNLTFWNLLSFNWYVIGRNVSIIRIFWHHWKLFRLIICKCETHRPRILLTICNQRHIVSVSIHPMKFSVKLQLIFQPLTKFQGVPLLVIALNQSCSTKPSRNTRPYQQRNLVSVCKMPTYTTFTLIQFPSNWAVQQLCIKHISLNCPHMEIAAAVNLRTWSSDCSTTVIDLFYGMRASAEWWTKVSWGPSMPQPHSSKWPKHTIGWLTRSEMATARRFSLQGPWSVSPRLWWPEVEFQHLEHHAIFQWPLLLEYSFLTSWQGKSKHLHRSQRRIFTNIFTTAFKNIIWVHNCRSDSTIRWGRARPLRQGRAWRGG